MIILTHCLRVGEITLKSVSSCACDPTHFLPVKPFANLHIHEHDRHSTMFSNMAFNFYSQLQLSDHITHPSPY